MKRSDSKECLLATTWSVQWSAIDTHMIKQITQTRAHHLLLVRHKGKFVFFSRIYSYWILSLWQNRSFYNFLPHKPQLENGWRHIRFISLMNLYYTEQKLVNLSVSLNFRDKHEKFQKIRKECVFFWNGALNTKIKKKILKKRERKT